MGGQTPSYTLEKSEQDSLTQSLALRADPSGASIPPSHRAVQVTEDVWGRAGQGKEGVGDPSSSFPFHYFRFLGHEGDSGGNHSIAVKNDLVFF